MKLFLVALLLCGASGHGFMDQGDVTLSEFLSKMVSPLPNPYLQLRRGSSTSKPGRFGRCSSVSLDKMIGSTSLPFLPLQMVANCITESLNAFQWDNSTNSTNETLLPAALIERSNLSEEQKKNVAESMKECITSNLKNWFQSNGTAEKCGSLKTLVCAARSFLESECAGLPSEISADTPDGSPESQEITTKTPDSSSVNPKKKKSKRKKGNNSTNKPPQEPENNNPLEGCSTSTEKPINIGSTFSRKSTVSQG